MRAYSGRVQLHHNVCNDGDHLCTWEPPTLDPAARMLSSHLCPGISVVSSLVISSLLTTWWPAFWQCSVGDSGYEYSHVTHTQVVISVLLAPDLSWCEVAWVSAPEHILAVDKLPSFGDCICFTMARPAWAWVVGFFNFNFDCDKCLG